jgi:hypothetical protein
VTPFEQIVLFAVVALALLSPFQARRSMAAWHRSRRWRDELPWPEAAAALGLREERPRASHEIGRAQGRVDGLAVALVASESLCGLGPRYTIRVQLPGDPGFAARRRRRDGQDGPPSGDPGLDAAVRFTTDDASRLRLACDAATRAALHRTVGRGAILADGELTRVIGGVPGARFLVDATREMVRCARLVTERWDRSDRLLGAVRQDPEWRVRLASLQTVLAEYPDALAVADALRVARADESSAIRLVASLASGDEGRADLVSLHGRGALVGLLQRSDPTIRRAAVQALAEVGDVGDVDLLLDVGGRPASSAEIRDAIRRTVAVIQERASGDRGALALVETGTGWLSVAG